MNLKTTTISIILMIFITLHNLVHACQMHKKAENSKEIFSHHLLQLRENHITGEEKIAAPELLYYELANVLATKVLISAKNASSALAEILNLEIETFTLGTEEFISSISVSRKYKISVYDAAYVILAERLNCDFITAYAKLLRKTTDLKFVKLLSDTM